MERKKENGNCYHENGNLEEIGNFKNGELEGEWKVYRKNGKLEKIENYKNGEREGEWKYYYENGKTLEAIVNYKNGDVISIVEDF